MFHPEVIQYTGHHEIHQIIHGFRLVVEPRIGRHHQRACLGHRQHVLQMNGREGRLPHHQDKLTPFLEHDIRRPVDEIITDTMSDGSQGARGAGADHQRLWRVGTAGHRRRPLLTSIDL